MARVELIVTNSDVLICDDSVLRGHSNSVNRVNTQPEIMAQS